MERAGSSSVLRSTADLDKFFAHLEIAPQRLLLLDYDGTLAPFHVHPARATPYSGVVELLDDILRDSSSTVIVVSGRPARDLGPLMKLHRSITIWGSHGWERLDPDGNYRCGPLDGKALRLAMQEGVWVREVRDIGGRVERKAGSVAIHWRGLGAEAIKQIREIVEREWRSRDLNAGLQWTDFDGGIELCLPGRNKGFVIDTILKEHPDAVAAYLGDDLADEEAFKAIRGRGLGILVRSKYRPTFAQAWLRPPDDVLKFLERWKALSGRRSL